MGSGIELTNPEDTANLLGLGLGIYNRTERKDRVMRVIVWDDPLEQGSRSFTLKFDDTLCIPYVYEKTECQQKKDIACTVAFM